MRVLVACEESQAVCKEFRELGHEAYSCDIIECSGGRPEWHIRWDALAIINGNCSFLTDYGEMHRIDGKWDMLIAFPPCTDLATSGARHFEKKRNDGRQRKSIEFFCKFFEADCERIVIENPRGIMSGGEYIKKHFPDLADKYGIPVSFSQIIHPYYFAKDENDTENLHEKATCLWCIGVEPLKIPGSHPDAPERFITSTGKSFPAWYSKTSLRGHGDRRVVRSKTFPGVAKAMAEQWGGECK